MQRQSAKRFKYMLYGTLAAMMLAAGIGTFVHHMRQVRAQVESTFSSRSALLSGFASLHREQLGVMARLMREAYQSRTPELGAALNLREYPRLGVWQHLPGTGAAVGTLTGDLRMPPDAGTRNEILSVYAMDPQLQSARRLASQVEWMYYVSAKRFIYLAPAVPVDRFRFTPELYGQGFWTQATPEANPTRRVVLSGPYEDLAGLGWMVTFSHPVYAGDRFLGVAALDLKLDALENYVRIGQATGESMLISEHGKVMAKPSGFRPGTILHPPASSHLIDWKPDDSGALWLSAPIIPSEMWLVHRVSRQELLLAAAEESLGTWLMTLLLGVVAVIARRLHGALDEVTRLTHTDPLTQVLNRRGFYEKFEPLRALARRKGNPIAVMLIDIDFFKKVNDTYGHGEGDSVLKQLGGYLLGAIRPFDLACRWGGEEFLVLLVLDRPEEALAVAERVRAEARRSRVQSTGETVTVSAGLVLLGGNEAIDEAVKRADALLYRAKHEGRDRIVPDTRISGTLRAEAD